jgi:hypothetical protein
MTPHTFIWHGADSGGLLSPVCIGPDYAKVGPVESFQPDALQTRITINDRAVSDDEAGTRARLLGFIDISNAFYDESWLNGHKAFDAKTVAGVDKIIAEAAGRLKRPFVTVLADFENPNTITTACHMLAAAFAKCGWKIAGIANYMTSHRIECPRMGVAPGWRMTPYTVPLSGDLTFISAYDQGGTNSFCTDAEFDHMLELCPRPAIVAIKHGDPQCAARAKKAKGEGFTVLIYVGKHDAAIPPALAKTLAGGIAAPVRVLVKRARAVKGKG